MGPCLKTLAVVSIIFACSGSYAINDLEVLTTPDDPCVIIYESGNTRYKTGLPAPDDQLASCKMGARLSFMAVAYMFGKGFVPDGRGQFEFLNTSGDRVRCRVETKAGKIPDGFLQAFERVTAAETAKAFTSEVRATHDVYKEFAETSIQINCPEEPTS